MSWIKKLGAGFIVGKLLRAAASGKYGSQAQWVYWHMRGIKTVLGGLCGVATAAIVAAQHYGLCDLALTVWTWFQCDAWLTKVAWLSGALTSLFVWLGQIDGALHLDAPLPPG